jgi:hypothetical protein
MVQTKPVRRKFFDLKPVELSELQRLDNYISYQRREAVKPPRLRASVYGGSTDDYQIDSDYYELALYGLQMAKEQRLRWLHAKNISVSMAALVRRADYRTYENAERVGRVAPPVPDWYRWSRS